MDESRGVAFMFNLPLHPPFLFSIQSPLKPISRLQQQTENMSETKFKLNTGAEIPALGLGTWQSAAGEVEKAVEYALEVGYKHVDAGLFPHFLCYLLPLLLFPF